MNKRIQSYTVLAVSVGLFAAVTLGCGVKGKPLPPLDPAQIGRGAPTYKRTAEQARPILTPTPIPAPDGRGR
jgi:hypothetical protein